MRWMVLAVVIATALKAAAADLPSSPADPRDITGVWLPPVGRNYLPSFNPVDGSEAPLTPAAAAEYQRRVVAYWDGHPVPDTPTRCLPHGVPRSMLSPYPLHIVQTPGQITIVHEAGHNIRMIYMDEPQAKNPPMTFMGHSVGRWEGNTLVVDTVAIDPETWIDEAGKPHSARLHVTERLRKLKDGTLENVLTLEDPQAFTRPWTTRRVYTWRSDIRLLEYICEENNRNIVENFGGKP